MNVLEKLKSKFKKTIEEPIEELKSFNKNLFIKSWCEAGPVLLLLGDQDLYTIFVVCEPGKAPRHTLEKFLKIKTAEIRFIDSSAKNKVSGDDYCKYVALPLAYALLHPDKPISKEVLAARDLFVHKTQQGSWSINHTIDNIRQKQH